MEDQLSTLEEVLANIFDATQPLVHNKLVHLSHLTAQGVNLFKKAWNGVSYHKQYEVLSQLVQLTEDNLVLNFDDIFGFCLSEPDERIRLEALTGLEGTEDPAFIMPLIHLLKEDNTEKVRAATAVVLGNFALLAEVGELPVRRRDTVYSTLRDLLINERETMEVKRRALEAIAPFTSSEVEGFINDTYSNNDVKLKASALYAMGRNCNPDWLPILIKELRNRQAEIRYEAAAACGELEAEEAVPYLINLLEDEDAQVQDAAIRSLGEIGGAEAKETLEQLIHRPEDGIRQAAEAALGELLFWEEPLSFNL
jgi:hypothetical protein